MKPGSGNDPIGLLLTGHLGTLGLKFGPRSSDDAPGVRTMRTKWIAALSLAGVVGAAAAAGAVNSAVLGAAAPVDTGRNSALGITEHNWPDEGAATEVANTSASPDVPDPSPSGRREAAVEFESGSDGGSAAHPGGTKAVPGDERGDADDHSKRRRPTSGGEDSDHGSAEPDEKTEDVEDAEDPPDDHADEDTPEARSAEDARSDHDED